MFADGLEGGASQLLPAGRCRRDGRLDRVPPAGRRLLWSSPCRLGRFEIVQRRILGRRVAPAQFLGCREFLIGGDVCRRPRIGGDGSGLGAFWAPAPVDMGAFVQEFGHRIALRDQLGLQLACRHPFGEHNVGRLRAEVHGVGGAADVGIVLWGAGLAGNRRARREAHDRLVGIILGRGPWLLIAGAPWVGRCRRVSSNRPRIGSGAAHLLDLDSALLRRVPAIN